MKKILAIKFKFLGDVAVTIPAFRALKDTFPDYELHVVVAQEAVPILKFLPWIDKIWAFPRVRGKIALKKSLPVVKALRKEGFDVAIDFVGNDRGALLTLLSGAKRRIGPIASQGFPGRKFCYRERLEELPLRENESRRNLHLVRGLGARIPEDPKIQIISDPSLAGPAKRILGDGEIICHLSTSRPKKEWPLKNWVAFYRLAESSPRALVFSSGSTDREQLLLEKATRIEPGIPVLPKMESLDLFLAVLHQTKGFISADTGPLHFAAGMGIPTLGLFGPSDQGRWTPLGENHLGISGFDCQCPLGVDLCLGERPCMGGIKPKDVYDRFLELW